MNFNEFLDAVHKSRPRAGGRFVGRLLALDPGETTGWSIWESSASGDSYALVQSGQIETWNKPTHSIKPCVSIFPQLLLQARVDYVIMESYRVYEWKSDSHSWSDVPTLRIIGSMETRLIDHDIPYSMQTAQLAKNFITDDKLKEWGYWKRGERHARDSMRHALFFLTFSPPTK